MLSRGAHKTHHATHLIRKVTKLQYINLQYAFINTHTHTFTLTHTRTFILHFITSLEFP